MTILLNKLVTAPKLRRCPRSSANRSSCFCRANHWSIRPRSRCFSLRDAGFWCGGWNLVKDQATERYGVVPNDGVVKVNKEYEMRLLSYDSS